MKKIDKLNMHFERDKSPLRRDLEAIHDKINECVKAINLVHGHYEPGDLPVRIDRDKETISYDSIDQVVENKEFYFKQINLAVLENCKYQVEKWRVRIVEVKIGYALQNEFTKFICSSPCQYVSNPDDICKMKIFGVSITFPVVNEETYYMKPNEILFISENDSIYARGIKK